MEREMIRQGKIVPQGDGTWRICSLEIREGDPGQLARTGDWFLLGDKGWPYPNGADWFAAHHRHVSGDLYLQIPGPVTVWRFGDPPLDALQFLLERGLLTIREEGFEARLWGTVEHAPLTHVVVFYDILRDRKGTVTDASFSLVDREEFQSHYRILPA